MSFVHRSIFKGPLRTLTWDAVAVVLTGGGVQRVVDVVGHPSRKAPVVRTVLKTSDQCWAEIHLMMDHWVRTVMSDMWQVSGWDGGVCHLKDVAERHGSVREAMDKQSLQQPLDIVERVTHTGQTGNNTHRLLLLWWWRWWWWRYFVLSIYHTLLIWVWYWLQKKKRKRLAPECKLKCDTCRHGNYVVTFLFCYLYLLYRERSTGWHHSGITCNLKRWDSRRLNEVKGQMPSHSGDERAFHVEDDGSTSELNFLHTWS